MATLAVFDAPAMLTSGQRVVVKIGSALLVDQGTGALRTEWLAGLAEDVRALRAEGKDVALVSSGAIALGRRMLNLPAGPLALEQAQASAAVGQIALARAYAEALAPMMAAQVLLTLDDTRDRRRYLNGRTTLETLLSMGTVPIVNENDTVATDEIRYGDNDRLAARVALMASADRLILLSDVDGLYTADPSRDAAARRLDVVESITPEIDAMAGGAASAVGSGGMRTKLLAAKTAVAGGCAMAIAHGFVERPLAALRNGAACTWFLAKDTPESARKQWIAGLKPVGALVIDAGAARAVTKGASLLPAGMRAVTGAFQRGDPVTILSLDGATLGAGLASYPAEEALAIAGLKTAEIGGVLGHPPRSAMVHRDDLVLWNPTTQGSFR